MFDDLLGYLIWSALCSVAIIVLVVYLKKHEDEKHIAATSFLEKFMQYPFYQKMFNDKYKSFIHFIDTANRNVVTKDISVQILVHIEASIGQGEPYNLRKLTVVEQDEVLRHICKTIEEEARNKVKILNSCSKDYDCNFSFILNTRDSQNYRSATIFYTAKNGCYQPEQEW